MNSETLLSRLRASFERCALLPEQSDTIRCERLYHDRPRSIYFFQATDTLPEQAELTRLHERVISPSYFRAEGPSRWSHYLVFVTRDENQTSYGFRERKRDVEEDKNYARKLVVFDSELDGFLDRSIVQPAAAGGGASVVNVWETRLRAAGLERIQSEDPRAPLIRRIRDGLTNTSNEPLSKPTVTRQTEPALPQIRTFDIKRFDDRKLSGTFELGRVNLIRGPNGSGKTSFLEAIEHYFCGATFRSGGAASELIASATFSTGSVVPYKSRSNDDYQSKDRRWYGRTTTRGNRLYEGFARFNFLNTDAAVHFSTDGNLRNLIELLSKIALGPDAAHTWTRIEQFANEIEAEIRPLIRAHQSLTHSVADVNARLGALKTISPQSEALWAHAHKALKVIEWPPLDLPGANAEATWFMQFQSLRSFVAASATIGTTPSLDELRQAHIVTTRDIDRKHFSIHVRRSGPRHR